jgi:hypothetical protein
MFKQVFRLSALLIASVSIASAAGGGAGGSAGGAAGGGAHGSGGHAGGSFGKPAVDLPGLEGPVPMYRRGGSNTYDWRSIAERAAIKHKSLANERTRCRRDRAEQPGPPSPDSAR